MPFLCGAFFFMKQIPLTKGYFALVDDEDFEWLSQWKWNASVERNRVYATRSGGVGKAAIKMHRQIMGLTDPKIFCDHWDNWGLNNWRSNLRVATKSQNAMNRPIDKRSTSGFKCVSWFKKSNKWRAYIVVNYRQKSLGLFDCPVDAARAYDTAAKELHGEFANLNFKD